MHPFATRFFLLGLVTLCACASPASSGLATGSIAPASGMTCHPQSQSEACTLIGGAATRLVCSADTSTWTVLAPCPADFACWEKPDPAKPSAKLTTCLAVELADGGPSDGHGPDGGTLDDVDKADAFIGTDGITMIDTPKYETMPKPQCGNGVCESGEAGTCAQDCATSKCGDGQCGAGESKANCALDCSKFLQGYLPCAQQKCQSSWDACFADPNCTGYYNCIMSCPSSGGGCVNACTGNLTASGKYLNDTLGKCMSNECKNAWSPVCGDGECSLGEKDCAPDCGTVCGDGACDAGEASSCPNDCAVCGDGQCVPPEDLNACPQDCAKCGDGTCSWNENSASCPYDCKPYCGDGQCTYPESPKSCAKDCPPQCGDGLCSPGESCVADCGSPGPGSGCTSSGDANYLSQVSKDPGVAQAFAEAQKSCLLAKGCLGQSTEPAKTGCVAACIQQSTPLSSDCATCHGAHGVCWASKCLSQCAVNSGSAGCLSCVATNCTPALDKCIAGSAPADACSPACVGGQVCDGATGKCVQPICTLPSAWSSHTQKIATWALMPKTEGCDLDGDGMPNNVLGKVSDLYKDFNKVMAQQVMEGKFIALFEAEAWPSGKPFTIRMLSGALSPGNASCDLVSASANCKYLALTANYDLAWPQPGTCPAKSELSAMVTGGQLSAVATGKIGMGNVPLIGIPLNLPLSGAMLTAQVTSASAWLSSMDGKLCGVVSKADLNAAIDAVPDELLKQIGDKATVKALLNSILKADIDTNGDGVSDSISAAFSFSTVSGTITGLK